MADDRPKLGLVLHSNLARRYAAQGRDHPLGRAGEALYNNYAQASQMQADHWNGVLDHLDGRGA